MKQVLALLLLLCLCCAAKSQCIVQDSAHKDTYYLCYNSNIKQSLFTISDSTGAVIWTHKVWMYKGFNKSTFKAAKLPGGTYYLTINDVFTATIVKRK